MQEEYCREITIETGRQSFNARWTVANFSVDDVLESISVKRWNLLKVRIDFNSLINGNTADVLRSRLIVIWKSIINERQDSLDVFLEQIQAGIRPGVKRVANFRFCFQSIKLVDVVDDRMRRIVHVDAWRISVDADCVKSVKGKKFKKYFCEMLL